MAVFYLNRESAPRRESAAADATVLEYLRAAGWTGTKEGCASGDCGACTAVVAELNAEGKPAFRGFNSCIAPMPFLARKWLITVEGLKQNGRLHPAQKAMVKAHGSQCGFCTPGFVMSLFAFCKSGAAQSEETMREKTTAAISGNLCRCTGYRPILAAAAALAKTGCGNDGYGIAAARKKLRELHLLSPPPSANDFSRAAATAKAPILAGGTDSMLAVTQQLKPMPRAVFIGGANELAQIKKQKDGWHIGAAANWESVGRALGSALPSFAEMLARFGSPQIRGQATIGGNIANASPVADGPPAFIVLGAELVLRRGAKSRRLPLEKFFLGYKKTALRQGEWIETVFVPKPARGAVFRIYKVSKRREDDISALLFAFCLRRSAEGKIAEAKIAAGGMAEIPKRAKFAEKALQGKPWTMQTFARAARELEKDFSPIGDMRASKEYRRRAAANLFLRFAEETARKK